jgi:ADYC domain
MVEPGGMSRILALVASWFIGGCVVNEDIFASTDQAVTTPNGISPNGISPNGISPNGISPNGITLNGISPNGISPNGTPIGVAGTGPPLEGADVVGSTWTGHLSDGTTVALHIDDAMQGTGANTDVWSYRLSVSADGTWRPLCLDPAGDPIFADTVRGAWNLAQGVPGGGSYDPGAADFTIACRGSAIAKCVELGYKPWTSHDRELAACVRALRGDYCGDGTPYTVNGTIVNIYDDDGIQPDGIAWDAEAEWTPDGASCVSKKKETRFNQDAHEKPWCFPHALKPKKSCGTGFAGGAVIITELPPL